MTSAFSTILITSAEKLPLYVPFYLLLYEFLHLPSIDHCNHAPNLQIFVIWDTVLPSPSPPATLSLMAFPVQFLQGNFPFPLFWPHLHLDPSLPPFHIRNKVSASHIYRTSDFQLCLDLCLHLLNWLHNLPIYHSAFFSLFAQSQ